jgi:hypothetical protein
MSTPPSSPYKSKVLIFLSRRSRRWVDQGAIAARRLKMAASWALQGLIYFIYAFFQTTHQMNGQVRRALVGFKERSNQPIRTGRSLRGSSIPTVDTTIQQALQEVAGFSLPDNLQVDAELLPKRPEMAAHPLLVELRKVLKTVRFPKIIWGNANSAAEQQPLRSVSPPHLVPVSPSQMQPSQTSGSVALSEASCASDLQRLSQQSSSTLEQSTPRSMCLVRGIATLLETRSLVLVTPQNQILDILTPEQQDKLRQRIIWEVADYGRYLRIQIDRRRTLAHLRFGQVNFPVFSPVRWLQQWIAWGQRSAGVLKAGRFPNALLHPVTSQSIRPSPSVSELVERNWMQLLSKMGVADSPESLPVDSTPPSLPAAFTTIQELSPFLLHPFRWAKHLWMNWVSSHRAHPQLDADASDGSASLCNRQNPGRMLPIQRLLPAPGWRSPKFTNTFLARVLPFIAPLSSGSSVAPSLIVPPVLPTAPPALLLAPGVVSAPAVMEPSQVSESAKSTTLPPTLTSGFSFTGAIALAPANLIQPNLIQPAGVHGPVPVLSETKLTVQAEQTAPEAQPNFIETRATVIGSERTVWQKVLHWLDQIFFWLENVLLALWKLIRLYL